MFGTPHKISVFPLITTVYFQRDSINCRVGKNVSKSNQGAFNLLAGINTRTSWKKKKNHNSKWFLKTAATAKSNKKTKCHVQKNLILSFYVYVILSVWWWETYQSKDESRRQTDWVSGNSGQEASQTLTLCPVDRPGLSLQETDTSANRQTDRRAVQTCFYIHTYRDTQYLASSAAVASHLAPGTSQQGLVSAEKEMGNKTSSSAW